MKHVLLSSAAVAGLMMAAVAPASAQEPALQLGVAGYTAGYAIYTGGDLPSGTRKFDFRKHSEVYLTGEVALDNGITAGAHFEMLADRSDQNYGNTRIQESYMYLSSSWGRVNFGEEDGVAYLLQVAAPSADNNIDGLRPVIGTIGSALVGGYAQDDFGYNNKFTYITPVFSGFQAGVSYTPDANKGSAVAGVWAPVFKSGLENGWELAARYEGSFDAVDLAIGAGYGHASQVNSNNFNKSLNSWNIGADLDIGAFGVGAAYTHSNNGVRNKGSSRVWVAGVDYKTGPYKLGLSYQNAKNEINAPNPALVNRWKTSNQWTAGGVYEWGPGMTFRGAVQYVDYKARGFSSSDAVQVTLGTQVNF